MMALLDTHAHCLMIMQNADMRLKELFYWSRRMYMHGRELSTLVNVITLAAAGKQRGYSSCPVCIYTYICISVT